MIETLPFRQSVDHLIAGLELQIAQALFVSQL
jgi:hypothetical protein